MKHLLTLHDLGADEFKQLIDWAIAMKSNRRGYEKALTGATVGLIFFKKSTRTRVSFESGIAKMGGTSLYLGVNDLQLSRGEPLKDTARVLSRYLSAIAIRTFAQKDLEELAQYSSIPIINALTDFDHPCQGLADLMTAREAFGDLHGRKVTWIGDGNNVCNALMFGAVLSGANFTCVAPKGFQPDPSWVSKANKHGGKVTVTEDFASALKDADVVSTDVWTSMGQEDENEKRLQAFKGYQVDEKLIRQAKSSAIFLHCLPAHRGEEVSDEVIEGKQSRVWDQAENRMWVQMALLEKLIGK